ncbi:hypothetical protein [Mycolicibacterium mageritense]|uniref:Uncharacterized protein n=1 Tax=Mycolicibacterium mageritense TaxID=53462 RepID=A0AAI8XPR0_MYCME|nr:hypothetical protein [Mycolicibacterium mageritense]BDY32994.1 hypothetical protein hbim_06966 [Mycolicibacterium mageritense]
MAIRLPIINSQLRHSRAVQLLESRGIAPTDDYSALRARLAAFQGLDRPHEERLRAAVIDGAEGDVAQLRALAVADRLAAEVDQEVLQGAHQALRKAYDGPAAYIEAAQQYDTIAAAFTAAVLEIDPTLDAAEVVDESSKRRDTWRQGQRLLVELEDAATALHIAGLLAGVELPTDQIAGTGPWDDTLRSQLLGLTVRADGLHRRKVWLADWVELVQLGAELKAVDLDSFQPYRKPAPLVERKELGPTGAYVYTTLDPEDDPDFVPAPAAHDIAFPQAR